MQSTQGKIEHPKGSGVTIRPVANRTNGVAYGQSYLVDVPGKVTGRGRQRRQFETLQAAKDWAAEAVNGVRAVGGRFVELEHADRDATLRLLDGIKERGGAPQDVVDDVLAALKATGASQLRLAECVRFALPRLAPAAGVVTVAKCAESFLAAKAGQVSKEHERTTGIYLRRVTGVYGELPVSQLDAVKINALVFVHLLPRGCGAKCVAGGAGSREFSGYYFLGLPLCGDAGGSQAVLCHRARPSRCQRSTDREGPLRNEQYAT